MFHASIRKAIAACLLCVLAVSGMAASPVDVHHFPDTESERRYRALVNEFRCPKCLNVNISGSDAPIAQDLRAAVYRLAVLEGRSDQEVRDFLQARYGDFVLYDPPLKPGTLLLWLGPAVFVLLGLGLVGRRLRRQRAAVLDAEDRRRLQAILDEQ
ncbi:MAG: cytochrome c-type biogenesis protein CcmH [Gammaproteobacteria bacterium]|nr:cytochrome c-type biogenesis protein CcmH [Gammaproteobacteria bacterium]